MYNAGQQLRSAHDGQIYPVDNVKSVMIAVTVLMYKLRGDSCFGRDRVGVNKEALKLNGWLLRDCIYIPRNLDTAKRIERLAPKNNSYEQCLLHCSYVLLYEGQNII